MQITIESTTKVVHLNGIPCRIWEGTTEDVTKLHCYIHRVAIDMDEPEEVVTKFQQQLEECIPPSPGVQAIPLYLLI